MHVVQIIDTLYRGGAQQLLITFAEEARRRQIETTVVSLRSEDNGSILTQRLNQLGTPVVRFPAPKMFSVDRIIRMSNFLRQHKFSVVHTHLTYSNIVGVLAARLANIPVVASLHLAGFDPSMVGRQQQIENIVLNTFCQQIIAVGYTTEEVYRTMLPNRTIRVIPNAVTPLTQISKETRDETRATIMGDSTRPMLITVGRLTAIKAQTDLIDAFALVLKQHPTACLVVVGSGEERAAVEQRIAHHELGDAVKMLGARDDVDVLLGSADLFVSSSVKEGLPIAMLEAMSVGLPIVGTTVGDVPHVLRDEAGFTVPPQKPDLLAAKIIGLLDNPDQLAQMRDHAKRLSELHYGPKSWVDQLINVYKDAHKGKDQREALPA